MHESPDDLKHLQTLLDESHRSMGGHMRDILTPERRLTADRLADMLQGMRSQALELGRATDLTVIQLPVSEMVQQFNQSDFSSVDHYARYIERIIREGSYDAVFSYQEELLDYVLVENGLLDRLGNLSIGATRSADVNIRSRRYVEAAPAIWQIDHVGAISTAADLLQELTLTRRRGANDAITIPLVRQQLTRAQ